MIPTPELWSAWADALHTARPVSGPLAGALLLALALALARAVRQVDARRDTLQPLGMVPMVLDLVGLSLRGGSALAASLAVVAWIPRQALPAAGIAGIALLAGLGWSARVWLPDLLAGLSLIVEGRLRPGAVVTWSEGTGQVRWVGLRTTRVRTRDGADQLLPNRVLLEEGFAHDDHAWPSVDVTLRAAAEPHAEHAQAAREAALLSPWRAPSAPVEVHPPPADGEPWRVRTRIVAWEHADEHERSVRRLFAESRGTDEESSGVDPAP